MDTELAIGILGKNELIREGLGRILSEQGFRVVATSPRIQDFLDGAAPVEMILVDANICDEGLTDCIRLHEALPSVRIILMADEFSAEDVMEAFNSDAIDGYLVKVIACKPLAAALRLAAMGEKVFPSQIIQSLGTTTLTTNLRTQGARDGGSTLSAREFEILCCLVDGDANKVISRRLSISDATVKVHIKAILRKLRVVNRTQAAIWAVSRGFGEKKNVEPTLPAKPERAERPQMQGLQAVAA
jgi:two-component system nitrate/nitrite response regulator NarL